MKRCLGCMEEYQEKEAICPHCGWMEDNFDTPKGILEPGNILKGRYIVGTVRRQDELDILYIGWDALLNQRKKTLMFLEFEMSAIGGQNGRWDNKGRRFF